MNKTNMNELKCPKCDHTFFVDDYDSGDCPNCGDTYYYWDDGWDYEKEECNNEGFLWGDNLIKPSQLKGIEEEKKFHVWLETFIKESGHSFGNGFFVELHTGDIFYNGTNEYKEWYVGKLEEYNKTHNK